MSQNYCVFWYPTIFHKEKVRREYDKRGLFIEISDKDKPGKDFYLKVEEIPIKEEDKFDCFHLKFTLADRKDGAAKTVECEFSYRSHTRNGFVTYSYDREKLKQEYWDVFFCSEDERTKAIDQLKVDVQKRIINKYKALIPSGMMVSPSDELIKDYVVDRILISFYHHAKGFYHEHEVQSQSDGKLVAYYYSKEHIDGHRDYLTTEPTLSNKNNEVINWYIDQFERQFIKYAENISKEHRDFSKRINLRRRSRNALVSTLPGANQEIRKCLVEYRNVQNESVKKEENQLPSISSLLRQAKRGVDTMSDEECKQELESLTDSTSETEIKEIRDLHKKLKALSKLCGDALTEYTYCKTLLGSKYNDDYKHDRYIDSDRVQLLSLYPEFFPALSTLDERRKKAFNIRNSIRYIECVKQNCSRWEGELTENLIEHVHNISKNHKKTLDKVELLSKANRDTLKESEKSNLYSSLLGLLSVGLGVISIGLALLTIEKVCKWVGYGFIGAGFLLGVVGGIRYVIGNRKLSEKASQNSQMDISQEL